MRSYRSDACRAGYLMLAACTDNPPSLLQSTLFTLIGLVGICPTSSPGSRKRYGHRPHRPLPSLGTSSRYLMPATSYPSVDAVWGFAYPVPNYSPRSTIMKRLLTRMFTIAVALHRTRCGPSSRRAFTRRIQLRHWYRTYHGRGPHRCSCLNYKPMV